MSDRWLLERLSSLCTVIAGQSPKASYYNDQGNGLPFYQGKKEFTDRLLGQPTTWTTNVTKVAEAGDVLMSVRAPVGPINQATEEICIGRGLAAIRPNKSLNRDYLWYTLMWLQPTIRGHAGAVFDSINKTTIESLKIPHPPLEEQRRIVAILDEAFEGMDRAQTHTDSNLADIEEFRQSFLRHALEGWEITTLGQVVRIVNGGTPKTKVAEYWGGSIQWLTPRDMGRMSGREIGQTPRMLTRAGLANSSARLVPQRSVILSTRAPIGHLAINTVPMAFNQGCRGLIPSEVLDHEFLFYVLYMNILVLQEMGTGTTFKELSTSKLKTLSINLPPIKEQRRIVAIVDEAFKGLGRARINVNTSLDDLNDLRQSFLQRAFAGDLK